MSFDALQILFYKLTLVGVLALLLVLALRHRPANERTLVLRFGIVLVMLLPFAPLVLPSVDFDVPAYFAPLIPPATGPDLFASFPRIGIVLLATVYGFGVLMLLTRLTLGALTLEKWTRGADAITCPRWRAAIDANTAANVSVRVSDRIGAPLSWGLLHPIILIDRGSLAQPAEACAIIAHEMAHIRRRDWLALVLSRMVVALFWPHPLVWLLDRALVQHSEEAADADAIGVVEPLPYASALIACIGRGRAPSVPANGIANRSGLARRIDRIVNHAHHEVSRSSRRVWFAIAGYLWLTIMISIVAVCAGDHTDAPAAAGAARVAFAEPLGSSPLESSR